MNSLPARHPLRLRPTGEPCGQARPPLLLTPMWHPSAPSREGDAGGQAAVGWGGPQGDTHAGAGVPKETPARQEQDDLPPGTPARSKQPTRAACRAGPSPAACPALPPPPRARKRHHGGRSQERRGERRYSPPRGVPSCARRRAGGSPPRRRAAGPRLRLRLWRAGGGVWSQAARARNPLTIPQPGPPPALYLRGFAGVAQPAVAAPPLYPCGKTGDRLFLRSERHRPPPSPRPPPPRMRPAPPAAGAAGWAEGRNRRPRLRWLGRGSRGRRGPMGGLILPQAGGAAHAR